MHTIMQEVEGQSDYTFFYNDNQIKLDKKGFSKGSECYY